MGEAGRGRQGEVTKTVLRDLDTERLEDPLGVKNKIDGLWSLLSRPDIPYALGIYGSCLRQLGATQEAKVALRRALDFARELRSPRLEAETILRYAMTVASTGDFEKALRISDESFSKMCRASHRDGIGRALVDQGIYEWHLERPSQAAERFTSALDFLAPSSRAYRYGAHLNLSTCLIELGDHSPGIRHLGLAKNLVEELGPAMQAKFLWAEGRLALAAGRPAVSEEVFRRVVPVFLESGQALEAALAVVELARAVLDQNRSSEATEIVLQSKKCLLHLPEDSESSIILAALLRHCATKFATEEVLERAATGLERERNLSSPLPRSS